MTRRLVCLVAFLAFPSFALAQPKDRGGALPPDKALATMQPGDGFQVELFAAEPMLFNPTSMDVDHKGRVWVAEAVNYRRKNFGRPIIRKEGDRIVVLIDTDHDGKADESKVFYQGEEIYGPLSVCVIPQPASPDRKGGGESLRVLVAQSPDILEFWDRDGDLKADGPPTKFLTGFGGFDHDHGVHGLSVGPDGKLYFTVGDAGVTGLQSSDGKGKKWKSNDSDVQKGTVWRCDLDGTNVELIAHNFRNNYEACVDSFGEIWCSDNDDDGNFQTRICFVMPGGNYGYGPRGAGQTHWHEEQPGIVHKVLRTGFGSPTGITFYEGSLFPKKYAGALLHCDAGPREVRAFFRKPKGAGYELDKEMILTSTDTWFRPSDVCVAPDGSIFVADWYDKGVGGHGMNDPQDGRIYRLTPKGHKGYTVPEVKLDTKEGVLAALNSPCLATRVLALAKLNGLSDKDAVLTVVSAIQSKDLVLNARSRWVTSPRERKVLAGPLTPAEKEMFNIPCAEWCLPPFPAQGIRLRRTQIIQGASAGGKLSPAEIEEAKKSDRYPVFREILLALRDAEPAKMKDLFFAYASFYDGQDHFYRAALNIACGTDPARRDAILADFDKHFPEWDDKVADLVWELRPKSVLPRLGKLLADPKLTATQKGRIVDILASNDDPAAGRTMLDVLRSEAAPETKTRAIEALKLYLPTKWKGLTGGKELGATIDALLKDEKTQITGLHLIAAANAVDRVDAVVALMKGMAPPEGFGIEAYRTLGKLRSMKSFDVLDAAVKVTTVSDKSPQIAAAINSLAALVTNQPKDEITAKALASLQWLVQHSAYPERQKVAVEALTGTRLGSQWLLDIHTKDALDKELIPVAGRLLRNSPYQDLNARAQLAFPAPGKLDPKKLPPIAELAKRTGDANRGKRVWAASLAGAAQCAKCHMVRGVGGQVGPDLSMIGKKGGRENILESILQPSKAIADQFVQHQVTTTADVTVSGLLAGETPAAITLRDANGKDTTVARGDISGEIRKLKISIMPEDIVAGLTEEELIDLVAYLETLKVAALTPDSFAVVGPFPGKSMDDALDAKYGPEGGPFNPKATYTMKGVTLLAWKAIRPDGKGYFDLAALHGPAANNSASYMYAEVESPTEQAAEVLLGVDDGARLWVNAKEVFVTRDTRAAAPEQHKVAVKLAKGKNAVLLKVANGNSPHGFYFSLTSPDETKVAGRK